MSDFGSRIKFRGRTGVVQGLMFRPFLGWVRDPYRSSTANKGFVDDWFNGDLQS